MKKPSGHGPCCSRSVSVGVVLSVCIGGEDGWSDTGGIPYHSKS